MALAIPLVLALAGPVYGSSIAFEFDTAPTATEIIPLVIGFQFSTNNAITVSSLGYYDDGGDGLLSSHEVGIFNSAGSLLVSATVSAGSSSPLSGHFRYVDITPFSLGASQSFTIAAVAGTADAFAYVPNGTPVGLVVDPTINIAATAGRYLYPGDNALHYPINSFTYTVYAGPDFQFDVVPVPEPGTCALLGLGVVPCYLLSRRRRGSAARS